jgi:hypothetical protein
MLERQPGATRHHSCVLSALEMLMLVKIAPNKTTPALILLVSESLQFIAKAFSGDKQ